MSHPSTIHHPHQLHDTGNGLHGRRGVERVWWFFFVAVQHDEEEDYDYSDDEGYDDHLWHYDENDDADGDDGDVGHGDYDNGNGNDDIAQWWWRVDVSTTIFGRTTSTDFSIFFPPPPVLLRVLQGS